MSAPVTEAAAPLWHGIGAVPTGFGPCVATHGVFDGPRAEAVVVGANFTFGHRASGTVDTLRELGERHGFTTHRVGLLHEAGTRCSSSSVREFLRLGDIHGATRVLGRPHYVEGTLRPAGADASELVLSGGSALPAPGRYLGRLAQTDQVTVRVTGDGWLIVESAPRFSGLDSVEFIDRKES